MNLSETLTYRSQVVTEGGYTWSEKFRHECEIKWAASLPVRDLAKYLAGVQRKRGNETFRRIEPAIIEARRDAGIPISSVVLARAIARIQI